MIRVTLADHDKKGTKKISTTNLFVGNIAEKCTEEEIRVLFDKFGQIESVRFFRNASTKPNTKNAIIQYMDSHSVELAFKSKSEMGNADDSLKISPLKQKKAPCSSKVDNFEEMANMMMMQMCTQEMAPPRKNQRELSPRIQMMPTIDNLSYHDQAFFANIPARTHRKSSSVDFLPAAKPQTGAIDFPPHSQFNGGYNIPNLKPNFAPKVVPQQANPVKAPFAQKPELSTRGSKASVDHEQPQPLQYNFVTLLDLFDDEDGLSESFYGVSPLRQSRGPQSIANSRTQGKNLDDGHSENDGQFSEMTQ